MPGVKNVLLDALFILESPGLMITITVWRQVLPCLHLNSFSVLMKYTVCFLSAALSCSILTSCFKDEAPNAECDIQKAFVVVDNWETVFNSQTNACIDVPSNTDQITFDVKDNADVSKMAPMFELTPGATITPAGGTELDFSNNTRHKYVVTSEDGAWHREYYVGFGSKLLPLKFSFENTDYYVDKAGNNKYYQWFDNSRGSDTKVYRDWATGNGGFRLSMGNALPEDYPTVSVDGGVSGKCVKLTTRSTGPFGVMSNMRLAAGNLFLGEFDTKPALTNTMAATRFGLPFDKKPLRFVGFYKYSPGETYQDKAGNAVEGKIDHGDIYAVLYRNHDDSGAAFVLNGTDVKTNPYIVALAEIGEVNATADWTPFDLVFKYKSELDPDLLRANGYSLAIVCTSSYEGADFMGAIGSTLYVDEFELVCEEQ